MAFFPLSIFEIAGLYVLAFVAINMDDPLYKICGYGCLVLQIPITVADLIWIVDTGTGGALTTQTLALDTVSKSTFVLVNVLFQFMFLYNMWQAQRSEQE